MPAAIPRTQRGRAPLPQDDSPETQTTAADGATASPPEADGALAAAAEPAATGAPVRPAASAAARDSEPPTLDLMLDLPLDVTVELGRTTMQLGEALALQTGSIIELNRLPGEPLDMHVNDRLVARGEVVVVNDALGLRVTEIIGQESRRS